MLGLRRLLGSARSAGREPDIRELAHRIAAIRLHADPINNFGPGKVVGGTREEWHRWTARIIEENRATGYRPDFWLQAKHLASSTLSDTCASLDSIEGSDLVSEKLRYFYRSQILEIVDGFHDLID